jgi:hypothetical protein
MRRIGWVAAAWLGYVWLGSAAEFVGSTPCEAGTREFLGGLAADAPCHCIVWKVTLSTNESTGLATTYTLAAQYRVPTRSNPNQSEDGPTVTSRGTWDIAKGAQCGPDAVVYRMTAENSKRSLLFVKVGENLLHLLNADRSLAVGNGGWSYTLNRAERVEKIVEPAIAATVPDMSYKISPMATGAAVFGVFEGRSPCHGIGGELDMPQHAGCNKVKWRVTLYQNPETSAPTKYKVEGTLFRRAPREGTWSVIRGTKTDPNAVVYRLRETEKQPALLLWRADTNVLFFLDEKREPMVGSGEFSYTLNRVAKK